MSRAAALSGGDPAAGQQRGGVVGDGGGDLLLQVADFAGERQDAWGQQPQGVGGGAGGLPWCAELQWCAATG
jgi:hypothetical protein